MFFNILFLLILDKVDGDDVYYIVIVQVGVIQLLLGEKIKIWGFNVLMLGQMVVFECGKIYYMYLVNYLLEVMIFYWYGLEIFGLIEDGGCYVLVYLGEVCDVIFKIIQLVVIVWFYVYFCLEMVYQVWQGLVMMVIIYD